MKIALKTIGAGWDSIFLSIVKLITTVTVIINTKILSLGLSLIDYGTYSQANLIISISTSVLLFGLGDALSYYYNGSNIKNIDKDRIVNTIYFIEIIIGLLIAGIIIFGRYYIAKYFSNTYLLNVIILLAFIPIMNNILYFYQILYISNRQAKFISMRNLFVSIIMIIITYVSVFIIKNIITIFIASLILQILQILYFTFSFKKKYFLINIFRIDIKQIKNIFSYSIPMGVYAFTNYLLRDIDKLVIGKLENTKVLAIYTNCSKILPFDLVAVSLSTVLIPYIMKYVSNKDYENSIKLFSQYLKIGYYSVLPLGFAVLTNPKLIINILYTSEYVVGERVFIFYIIDSMIRFSSIHLIISAARKIKTLYIYSFIALALNLVLDLVLYRIIGMEGPAVATLIVSIMYTSAILKTTKNIINANWKDIFYYKDIIRFMSFMLVIFSVMKYASKIMLSSGVNSYIVLFSTIIIELVLNIIWNYKDIKESFKIINNLKIYV